MGTRCSALKACGIHPLVSPFILEAHFLHQLIGLCGAWATTDVGDGLGNLTIDLLQQWGKDVPGLLELVTVHKVHLASIEDVQDEMCSYASGSFTFLYLFLEVRSSSDSSGLKNMPGFLVITLAYTASLGCTRITSLLRLHCC